MSYRAIKYTKKRDLNILATETELKLTVTADDLVHLLKHPLLANLSRRKKLYNIYYDTPELALMKNAIAVRERIILRKTLLTVKLDQNKLDPNNFGGLSQRSEWEGPSIPGQFDFQTLIDDVATLNFLSQLTPQLSPIFTTDFPPFAAISSKISTTASILLFATGLAT